MGLRHSTPSRMLSPAGICAAVFVLSAHLLGCSEVPSEKAPAASFTPQAPVTPRNESAEKCKAAGGQWAGDVQGRGRLTGCLMPTADSNKVCSDSSQCQSVCLHDPSLDLANLRRGRCWRLSQYKGCRILTVRNSQQRTICVD
jgi:hypothetical protein